jgi:hypothetical protein
VHFILFAALVLAHPLLRSRYHAVIRKIVGYGAATILVGLTILEGRNASQLWIPYSRTQDFYPSTEVTEFLRRNIGYSRVIALDRAAVPGLLFGQGIPIAAGRSLPRQPYLEMLRLASPALHKDHPTQSLLSLDGTDLDSPVWSLANVNFFIAGSQIDKQSLQRKYGDRLIVHSFSDGTVLERASPSTGYLAKNRLVRASNVEEIKKLVAEGLDLRDTIVVDSASFQDRVADDVLGCEEPTVRDFRLGTNSISALVTNTCPTYFMPSVFLERGWTAYVNGKAHQVYTAYGFLPVIRIESVGENRVEFRYFPAGLKAGSLISVASLIVFTLLLVLDKSLSSKRESRLPAKM